MKNIHLDFKNVASLTNKYFVVYEILARPNLKWTNYAILNLRMMSANYRYEL